MGRRRRNSSSGGTAFLFVLALLVAAAIGAYRFALANREAIIAVCVASGAVVLLAYFLRFLFRRARNGIQKSSPPNSTSGRQPILKRGPAPRELKAHARWVTPADTVKIGATTVPGGLFYLGERLALGAGTTSKYVVNPSLPSKARPDVDGASMQYWPSYDDLTPSARRAFLDWMASGRKNAEYGIGHVFLFFYGLEHRFFIDADQTDAAAIYWEVDRLLGIYGENNSFRGYATAFLNMAQVLRGAGLNVPKLSPERAAGREIDLAVRLHLGARLAAVGTLTADEALMWLVAEPNTMLRTPAARCFDEFVVFWRLRFSQSYPKGLAAKPQDTINLVYRAASGAFEVAVPGPHKNYPDISATSQSLAELRQLAQACTDELEPFSRLIGRQPSARHSMAAVALLPAELQLTTTSEVLTTFKREVHALIGSRGSANPVARSILALAGIDIGGDNKISGATADELGKALDRIDVAIEPDRRFGSGVPRADEQVLLFSAPGGGPVDAQRAPYKTMRLLIEVAILAAAADGTASEEEVARTIARIRASSELSRIEQARLIAYAALTFKSPPKQARVMARLKEIAQSDRKAIADAAIAVIGGDTTDANDVKFLERLYKVLGLPREDVYVGMHRATAKPDEPVPVSAEVRVPGIPISKRDVPKRSGMPSSIKIDPSLLERRRRESEAASELLSNIFADEGPQQSAQPAGPVSADAAIAGLDALHSELVELLGLRGSMARVEFDRHARDMKLLPDGAIERINNWSFDRFEEALIEDGDELVVAPHLRARIGEMRENA